MRYDRLRDSRPFRQGPTVEQNCVLLSNYYHFLREIVHLHAGWMPRVSSFDVKILMGIHLHEDAMFAERVADRIAELGQPGYPGSPGPETAALFDFLRSLTTWQDYVAAVYNVFKPSLIDSWESHFTSTDPLLDEPTTRLLADCLRVTSQHINGGMALIETILYLGGDVAEAVHAATRNTRRLMAEIGGNHFAGTLHVGQPPRWRSFPPLTSPTRDSFLTIVEDPEGLVSDELMALAELNDDDRLKRELRHYLHSYLNQELIQAEICALNSHENPHLPLWFHNRMARQTWDNLRHAQVADKLLGYLGSGWGAFPISLELFADLTSGDLKSRLTLLAMEDESLTSEGRMRFRDAALQLGDPRFVSALDYFEADTLGSWELARDTVELLRLAGSP